MVKLFLACIKYISGNTIYPKKMDISKKRSLTCVLVSGFKLYYDEEITHVSTVFE